MTNSLSTIPAATGRSVLVAVALLWLVAGFVPSTSTGTERPNILWITAEDMSPTLGCYGDDYATTPHIDELAAQSVRYTHAFATAPVCSPSRSCLITGCYAPTLGTHNMRSAFPLPDWMNGFPALLRAQGYYTSNRVKTDYNTSSEERLKRASWDESSPQAHWRNRRDGQPFFSVFNLMTSHQSRTMAWPREQFLEEVQSRLDPSEIHDPEQAPVPPYYPDTPIVRRTLARYYDCVTAMDREVGEILDQLTADGLDDETIVFFYSDHGSGMPRHKRVLLDTGSHVPLLIRFPRKYAALAPAKAGESVARLVSFVDFPPTVLRLANVEVPAHFQGFAFLGVQAAPPRQYVFGHRDRIDEALDTARTVRDGRFLYIRNFMPHLGYNQPSAWPDQGEIQGEFSQRADPRTMTSAQWHFAGPRRPVEELYDCETDPLNLHDLTTSVAHESVLQRMRTRLRQHLLESRDLGFVPEIELWQLSNGTTPWEVAEAGRVPRTQLLDAAERVGVADEESLVLGLASPIAGVRYWSALGLAARPNLSDSARNPLLGALKDESYAVRIEAASALAQHGSIEPALPVLIQALGQQNLTAVLYAARAIELLGSAAADAAPAMRRALARAEAVLPAGAAATNGREDLAMFIGFSTRTFVAVLQLAKDEGQDSAASR